jgi:hypothetical protein
MIRKTAWALILGLAVSVTVSAAMDAAATFNKQAGLMLLTKISHSFQAMAESGSGGPGILAKVFTDLMKEAKQNRKDAKIDAVFFQRFSRVLRVLYAAVLPDPDETGILKPLIEREMGDFVLESTGENWTGSSPGAIGQLANAVALSLIDLRIYLDTLSQREAIMKSFWKGGGAGIKK